MKSYIFFILLFSTSIFGSEDIVIIYVDEKTEKKLGDFPIDRSHYSRLIRVISKYDPRYIILKFFYDQKKEGDDQLISELKKHKNVFTQAFSYQGDNESKIDISKYSIGNDFRANVDTNKSLIFPYKEISRAFSGIGFVNGVQSKDGKLEDFQIISSYEGNLYPSLPLLVYSSNVGAKPEIRDKKLYVGAKVFNLGEKLGMNMKFKNPTIIKNFQ